MQCFHFPGGNRVLTRASVSYLWCNVSTFLVVTVSLLVLLSLISGAMFPSPGGNRVLTRACFCLLSLVQCFPLLVVTVSLLVLLSLISGAMFPSPGCNRVLTRFNTYFHAIHVCR